MNRPPPSIELTKKFKKGLERYGLTNRCGTPTSGCKRGLCDSCDVIVLPQYAKCWSCNNI